MFLEETAEIFRTIVNFYKNFNYKMRFEGMLTWFSVVFGRFATSL